jgi:amino acid transporter
MTAAVLGAVDRHLAGHHRWAFALGLAAALLRPEAWPFFGLYGLWLVWRERSSLKLVAAGFASLPVLWFGPELWGSGNLNRASDRAQQPNPNSPAFAEHPALEVVRDAWAMVTWPVVAGAVLVLVALALRRPAAAGKARVVGVLALMAVTWLGIVASMTSNGFSGNQRYLVMPVTLAVVVACVGIGWAVRELRGAGARAVLALAVVAGVAFTAPYWSTTERMVDSLGYQGRLLDDLERSIADAGGPARLRACGSAATGAFLVPQVAWQLGVHANDVTMTPARPGVVFRVATVPGSNPVPPLASFGPGPIRTLADNGNWRLLGDCG